LLGFDFLPSAGGIIFQGFVLFWLILVASVSEELGFFFTSFRFFFWGLVD
jgi:hypothetical protein